MGQLLYIMISIFAGIAAGIALAKLLAGKSQDQTDEFAREIADLRAQLGQKSLDHQADREKLATEAERSNQLASQLQTSSAQAESLRNQNSLLSAENTRISTELTQAHENLKEQKDQLTQAQTKLADVFKSLSGEALKSNNQAFLALAEKTLEKVLANAKGDISKSKLAIDNLVKPLSESLKKYESQIASIEKSRVESYSKLSAQVAGLFDQQEKLRKETNNLTTALRKPDVRGRWGEVTLKRVAELSGMVEHCDFQEQVTVGEFRPDMVVQLPAGRQIVVDSKVALDGYLHALEADDAETRDHHLTRHARHINEHVRSLSSKSYWSKFENSPEFVVMFIPGDSFLSAALDKDHTLVERAMENGVIIATPTTLVALLRAVAFGWRQEQIADNARKISDLGKELYDRIKRTAAKFVQLGTRLNSTTKAYNETMGALERRVLPTARKFRELGVTAGDEIEMLNQVETLPREATAPEFSLESYQSESVDE